MSTPKATTSAIFTMSAVVTIFRMQSADIAVDGEDLRRVVTLAIDTLRDADPAAWEAKAGTLEWTCWETLEHLADDLFTYAARFGLAEPPTSTGLPFRTSSDRSGGPENVIFVDRASGPEGLLTILEACGGLLASVLRTAPSTTVAHHVFGPSDPEGFAAMAVVETLVHTHDITQGLNLEWSPPRGLCERVLRRLFPHVAIDFDVWQILLWATGRTALPHRPRLTEWRWYGTKGA
ncbi:maleylpyruvate isomerase N-terminal domain-containing protein [Streptomyces sp. NPDC054866]